VTPGDEAFLRRLYTSTRDDLVGIPGLGAAQTEALVDLQFRAQRDGYRRAFPTASHQVLVVGGRRAGRLYVDRVPGVVTVVDIALLPEFRGRGLGTVVLGDLQAEATTAGSVVRLEARAGGRPEALYRRLGFVPVGTTDPDEPGGREAFDVALEWRPENWLPIEVAPAAGGPRVQWFEAGPERAQDPFFIQTFQRAAHRHRAQPSSSWRRSGTLAEMIAGAERDPGLGPSGFIAHMSRCGSTLLAQMLAADPANLVISEPPALDGLLRLWLGGALDEAQRRRALRALVATLGRPRHGERRLFVKLEPWHTCMLPVLRRTFPTTPWVFVSRDPLEVLVSHERRTAAFMAPGGVPAAGLGLEPAAAALSPEDYGAAVLSAICRAARAAHDDGGLLLDYRDLPGALGAVLAHFGLEVTGEELAQMIGVSARDAKAPTRPFVPDGEAKSQAGDTRLRAAAASMSATMADLARARGAAKDRAAGPVHQDRWAMAGGGGC